MMQKNLMKTVCMVFLALSGTGWPWISANAQDYTVLTAAGPFPAIRQPNLVCSTHFQCVDQGGNPADCHLHPARAGTAADIAGALWPGTIPQHLDPTSEGLRRLIGKGAGARAPGGGRT